MLLSLNQWPEAPTAGDDGLLAGAQGDAWLADRVYSGVPASWIGRSQTIEIGHMSGGSNVTYYLRKRGLPHEPAVVEAILDMAKKSKRLLSEDEVLALVQKVHPETAATTPD